MNPLSRNKPAKRLANMGESVTLSMTLRARELAANGNDVINLSLGLPNYDTPDYIKNAGKQAIDDNFTRYSPVAGFTSLRTIISDKLSRDNQLKYAASQIVISAGAKHVLANLAISILNPDDEVIILAPYWISHVEIVKIAGAKPVLVTPSTANNFKHSIDKIEAAITRKTRMLWLSTPNNPTGTVMSKKELKAIANLIKSYPDILVVSDEIYEYINFQGKHESISQFNFIREQVITVNGVSKGYAMSGWRIGYMAAPQWIADACIKMQGQFTSGVCSISQKAAERALVSKPENLDEMLKSFKERRDLMVSLLSEIEGVEVAVPDGAFFVFPNISSFFGKRYGDIVIDNAEILCNLLLEKEFVAIVDGKAFGDNSCIRISFAVSLIDIRKAMERIKRFFYSLNVS